ncbi:type II toxin-antitoxin system prevent-host-death family antitoxin [Hymenobacter lapidiphilus]|nr:type II toxin-antitoxin system prevent-host-death family antitoxin [Hymenobacter sp. CCM 8763]
MRITLEVPEHRAAFMLELLRSLPFVKLRGQAAKAAVLDETAHLLSSPANAARLRAALKRDRLGQHETHSSSK